MPKGSVSHAFLKSYFTPGTLSGILCFGSIVFLFKEKYLRASFFLTGMQLIHLSYFPLSLLFYFWIIFRAAKKNKIISSFIFLPCLVLKIYIFLKFNQIELLFLTTDRYRELPNWPFENITSFRSIYFFSLLLLLYPLGTQLFPQKSQKLILFLVALGGLSYAFPLKFQLVRITPQIEIISLILIMTVIFHLLHRLNPHKATSYVLLLSLLALQINTNKFVALHFFSKDPVINPELQNLYQFIRENTPKNSLFYIPPSLIDFKSSCSRTPYVDIGALPWNAQAQGLWDERLRHVLHNPHDDWQTFTGLKSGLQLPVSEALRRARGVKADYLLWSKPQSNKESLKKLYEDENYVLIALEH